MKRTRYAGKKLISRRATEDRDSDIAGISLPLSVTFANATELINEKVVRGNFGITFDQISSPR